jgi:hypothetical protein
MLSCLLFLSVVTYNIDFNDVKKYECDVIELNYVYRDSELEFSQFIFRDWSRQLRNHYIIDFVAYSKHTSPPKVVFRNGRYVLIVDKLGNLMEIRAKRFTIIHSNYDIEMKEREAPDFQRAGFQ